MAFFLFNYRSLSYILFLGGCGFIAAIWPIGDRSGLSNIPKNNLNTAEYLPNLEISTSNAG